MRLSEAMRLGAMLGPQAHGALTRRRRKYFICGPVINEYCALGAAFIASGAQSIAGTFDTAGETDGGFRGAARHQHKAGDSYVVIKHQWTELAWEVHGCPLCPGEVMPVHRLIPHLNDDHRWTRERIADFVEAIERAQETARAVEPVEVSA